MKNQWRELLETLAEELYGPGGRLGRRREENAPGGNWADGGAGEGTPAPLRSAWDGDSFDGEGFFPLTGRSGAFLPLETAGIGSFFSGAMERIFSPDRAGTVSFFAGTQRENGGANRGLPVGAGSVLTGRTEEPETESPPPGGRDGRETPGGTGERAEDIPLPGARSGKTWEYGAAGLGRRYEEAEINAEELDRAFQRDARRYDGGFSLY